MNSMDVHINRYEELVRWREVLGELQNHSNITTMAEYLSYSEPERLCWRSITPGLYEGIAALRGDIHKKIKAELEVIAKLLYAEMRPEVDRLAALKKKHREQAEIAAAVEADKRAKYDAERREDNAVVQAEAS